jgi:predicted metal-binding membrane protein
MVVAMMLPVMLPFVMRFSRSIPRVGDRVGSVFLLVGGYLLAWTVFGIAAHVALQVLPGAIGLPPGASLLIGPAALVMAGAYQFSPLKRRSVRGACSTAIFAPLSGKAWPRRAHVFALGLREGLLCIGCCWALMLLMLVGVAGGTGGMLVLGIIMYAEKNAARGPRWIMPVGMFLIGLGLVLGWGTLMGFLSWQEHAM